MRRFKTGGKVFPDRKVLAGIVALIFCLCLFAGAQNAFANGSSSATPALVETQWLADNLDKSGMRTVYVGSPSPKSMANFGSKHVPGSVFVGIGSLMDVLGNGSAPPDKAKFEALMGKLGISNDTHVLIYGMGGGNPFITNAFWLMKYFGHEKVSYLNGGMTKWVRENRKTATGAPAKVKSATYKAAPDASVYASTDYVLQSLKNSKVVMVDARGADAYKGIKNEMPGKNKRTGRIPGAVNLNFYPTNLNKDGTFKSVKDLKAAYEAKGVTKDKEAIIYCQAGIRAAHTYFVLKHLLGYPKVRNYVGSWGEWSNSDPAKYPLEK
ncbi:MAG TPA: sulfurtransferase [Nitrospirae bacterium]|nr:thiosulfate sulfurtransferase [bacterium BMS3Abin10]HDK81656.1 sulfurtransferase [Nitrospirota bacterium]